MTPYFQDNSRVLYNSDCRSMTELPEESVQCVVTSPPYWGLRTYNGEQELVWGGKNGCEHEWQKTAPRCAEHTEDIINLNSKEATNRGNLGIELPSTNTCSLCGAWRGGFGLEPNPDLYVRHTIEILREIRRVLRKDGVVFWDIGDCYASGKGTCHNPGGGRGSFTTIAGRKSAGAYPLNRGNISDLKKSRLKPKDLCLIPFRIAIAAQEDGWWVRSVIVWNKLNTMPESVVDRPVRNHEYILMLTRSARYYWDRESVRTAYKLSTIERADNSNVTTSNPDRQVGFKRLLNGGANLRSVWSFATQPYGKKHYATFPEKLPATCIKAATPEIGCCPKCGAPWTRIIERKMGKRHESEPQTIGSGRGEKGDRGKHAAPTETKTVGWEPSCKCQDKLDREAITTTLNIAGGGVIVPEELKPVPSIVLDPFAGSGTTLKVAAVLGRRAVGYEISGEYCRLAVERNNQHVLV